MQPIDVTRLILVKESTKDIRCYTLNNMIEVLRDRCFSKILEDMLASAIRHDKTQINIGLKVSFYNHNTKVYFEISEIPGNYQEVPEHMWSKLCPEENILSASEPLSEIDVGKITGFLIQGFDELLKQLLDSKYFDINTFVFDKQDWIGWEINFDRICEDDDHLTISDS